MESTGIQQSVHPSDEARSRPSETVVPFSDLQRSIAAARERLFELQQRDGHWCAELEGDTILESEYALVLFYLGMGNSDKVRKAAVYLRRKQLNEGGWPIFPGGKADVSASVKAYFVLKLVGDDPEAPHMIRARQTIRRLGGLDACNSFTKIYLSIFGQYDWNRSPGVPPELILFPKWFPFNIYEMSSWSRAIVIPLSIIWAHKPVIEVPKNASIDELKIVDSRVAGPRFSRGSLRHHGWSLFFQALDRVHKLFERVRFVPLRRVAIRRAEKWMLERLEKSDGLGAIFPPIVNTLIALRCLGYAEEHPTVQGQIHELVKLEIEDSESLRVQPCKSPVWDTALAINALAMAAEDQRSDRLAMAVEWLLEHEVREVGDWVVKNPKGTVGGWYFEYANEFYPDCDDTAQILSAVNRIDTMDPDLGRRWSAAAERALAWLMSMQNRDGGWASFDKGCNRKYLTYIPFADHNAMIDPSTTDITARVLEACSGFGYNAESPAMKRAIAFIREQQCEDGSWYGRWGCNYLYGTWLALWGLKAIGVDMTEPWIQRAEIWVRSCQNSDGGWGESPESYTDKSLKGVGASSAAQTSWAIMSLLACGDLESHELKAGIEFLLNKQREDGSWKDGTWTGTGFPEVFYLDYHLYATYFPLLALETWRKNRGLSSRTAQAHEINTTIGNAADSGRERAL
ncbi:MAG: squalene--hopene cyclase [Acidobacteriota bacterium]